MLDIMLAYYIPWRPVGADCITFSSCACPNSPEFSNKKEEIQREKAKHVSFSYFFILLQPPFSVKTVYCEWEYMKAHQSNFTYTPYFPPVDEHYKSCMLFTFILLRKEKNSSLYSLPSIRVSLRRWIMI